MTRADQETSDVTLGVLGLGHVGLPTALGLAELGWTVVGADDDEDKARKLSEGKATFYEPGLEELLHKHLESGRFRVAEDGPDAVRESTVLFVCVGTPQQEDGSADLSQVENAARTVAEHLNGYKLIVEKSTNPVSTAEKVKTTIARHLNGGHECEVAVNPEFLREGRALEDFFNPDRIVVGVESDRARDLLLRIYEPLLQRMELPSPRPGSGEAAPEISGRRVVVTDLNTAELIKHSSNAFLAMKVSFINMVADLCEAAGADVDDVARGLGMDPRIGPDFLQAGVGFGGYCLPKDLKAFTRITQDHGVDASLLEAIADINDRRVDHFVSKVRTALGGIDGRTLAVWGLAFKPGTDDVRDAPSLRIVSRLLAEGASLRLYDPKASSEFQRSFAGPTDGLAYSDSATDAAAGADAILLLSEWPEFRLVDFPVVREDVATALIVDGRNFLDQQSVAQAGFEYIGMGR